MRARLSFRALTLFTEAARRSINSASFSPRATDHSFATRVIKVNESSTARIETEVETGRRPLFPPRNRER